MSQVVTNPRIAPVEPPYEPEIDAILKKWMPPGAETEPLRLFRTLAVHDELASRMRPIGAGILGHGRVEPREREIVIHRTCAPSTSGGCMCSPSASRSASATSRSPRRFTARRRTQPGPIATRC
jgi:hypothetical protein